MSRDDRRSWLSGFLDRAASLLDRSDFVIRHRPGGPVVVRGRIPKGKIPAIVGFFKRDLNPTGPATVRGTWEGRVLRLRFSRGLDPADQQRARNFLIEHLG